MANTTTIRCQERLRGRRRSICGVGVITQLDAIGRVIEICPACERNRAGLCRECPAPIVGRALLCATCNTARKAALAAHRLRDPETRARRAMQQRHAYRRHMKDPAFRKKCAALKRSLRARQPDTQRTYKRKYFLKQTPGYIEGYQRRNANRRDRRGHAPTPPQEQS
jgi:hypothetical protein